MESWVALLLVFLLIVMAAAIFILITEHRKSKDTQRDLIDADLLKLIHDQPDGLLSPHMLAEQSGLTLAQARTRLAQLFMAGVLQRSHNRKARYFYGLREPYTAPPEIAFSPDPFLTVEDLLQLFEHNGGRVSLHQMIVATRLPLKILQREMKHFEREGVLQQISTYQDAYGGTLNKFYVLQEPYRSNPGSFLDRAGTMDLELQQLLRKEKLIV